MNRVKNIIVLAFLLFSVGSISAQDRTVKWAFGVGASFVNFSETSGFDGEGVNFQIPNLSLLRYIDNGFTVGFGVTLTGVPKINNFYTNEYDVTMMDFFGKYDFGLTEKKIVPQLIGGVGLLVKDKYDRSISVNAGVGLTYWVLPKLGLNGKIVHRFVSEATEEDFGSHTQFSGSIIVTFGESNGSRNWRRKGHGFTTN